MNDLRYQNNLQAAQDAIDLQGACNLTGVAHTLWQMCRYAMETLKDSDKVRQFPPILLTIQKICDMTGQPDFDHYLEAYDACREMIAAETVGEGVQ